MKKTLLTLLLSHSLLLAIGIKNDGSTLNFMGFSQLTMRDGAGIKDKPLFKADRLRLATKYSIGQLRYKLFVDFAQGVDRKIGDTKTGIPDIVKDAFIGYRIDKAFFAKVGVMKMPNAMCFTMPGWNLDIAERNPMDKGLSLERNLGIMISGRDIGWGDYGKITGFEMGHERPWKGFGYDLMIGTNAGRSKAINHHTIDEVKEAKSYALRAMFDWTESFHAEASYALQENAGGLGSADYHSSTFGLDSHWGASNIKAEYLKGENLLGFKGDDQKTFTITGSYAFNQKYEAVIKHIESKANVGEKRSQLNNDYLGFNIFIFTKNDKMDRISKRSRNANKIVINYVKAHGDKSGFHQGLNGYVDDVGIIQFQSKF